MKNGLWAIASQAIHVPRDATQAIEHKLKDIRAKSIILDGVKNHIIPHITKKDSAYQMSLVLTKLYQSDNQNRNMVLREKLNSMKMNKSEIVASYSR